HHAGDMDVLLADRLAPLVLVHVADLEVLDVPTERPGLSHHSLLRGARASASRPRERSLWPWLERVPTTSCIGSGLRGRAVRARSWSSWWSPASCRRSRSRPAGPSTWAAGRERTRCSWRSTAST